MPETLSELKRRQHQVQQLLHRQLIQYQTLLDRWYGADRKAIFPGKRVILTIPFEDTYAAAPRHTVGILTEALNYVGAEVVATVLAPGVHRRGEVRERADRMDAARNAGREATEGQKGKAGLGYQTE